MQAGFDVDSVEGKTLVTIVEPKASFTLGSG